MRHLKKGINPSSFNKIYFTGSYAGKGFRIGVVTGMIALTVILHLILGFIEFNCVANNYMLQNYQEATAIRRTFAALKDYQLDGNKEMVALGTMNIAGSMTSCYCATGKY